MTKLSRRLKKLSERVDQLETRTEEDIQTITFSLRELNTWKRNQVTRQLPERVVEKMPEEELEDEKDV